jgi:hypothetical protein
LNTFTTAIQEAAWDSTAIKRKLKGLNFLKEIHMTKLFSTELVNSYPRRLKTLNKHQLNNSSQNSLQIIAQSIHSGKLQNI